MVKRGGRFSGEAFVVLQASHQIDFSLQKNKTYMGKRYVEVFRVKKLVRGWLTLTHQDVTTSLCLGPTFSR